MQRAPAAQYDQRRASKEVWFCDNDGNMRFFNPQGELKRSEMFGEFPAHIDIEIV
ncbi:MAG: hypothetical protein P4L55_17545 [Syntrophobacteraceae bacterium]|nr:hypothetical protein [Syntrophobacteraceae bacterium]